MKLRLLRKYKGGWITVAMLHTIGELDWLHVFDEKEEMEGLFPTPLFCVVDQDGVVIH